MGEAGSFFVRELWTDVPTLSFATSSAALTGPAQSTHSTLIGFDRSVSPTTTVESSYLVDHTASGTDAYALFGVKETLKFSKYFTGDAFAQTGNGNERTARAARTAASACTAPTSRMPTATAFTRPRRPRHEPGSPVVRR